uniref:colicin E5-related ribonuclease n=1 Tax=uncultured Bacteroides sp. TaxID=162156 RepID=UPI00272D5A71
LLSATKLHFFLGVFFHFIIGADSSLAGMYKPDFFCYLVPSYQFIQLGTQVVFKEQSMVICEQDATLQDGELIYSYKIGHTGWFSQQEIKNEKLIGLSLPGTVVDTDREVVRLNLDIDAGRNAGTYPFSWIPESGNIMYCMPKLGTRATLYMPSHNTGEAVAITSPRTNGDNCSDMANPQMRAFTTEHGKKMLLFPQSMILSGGIPGETLQIKFDDIKCMSLESTRAIQIVAKLQIEIVAPRVALNTPQQLGTSRSPAQAAARISLIVPKGTGGGNPPTGGGDTTMFMEYQFDALGEQGILCGTEFHDYSPYNDAPEAVEIAQFSWGKWALNLIIGAAITAAFVGAAIATAGTSVILTGALVGAAVGAGVATTAIAVSDAKSRSNRSTIDAIFGVAGGALFGATAGAAIAAAPLAAEFYTPLINAQLAIWGIEGANVGIGVVTTGFLGVTGLNALFTANNVVAMNSGYDFLGGTALFQNHPNIYMGLQIVTAVASMNILGAGLAVETTNAANNKRSSQLVFGSSTKSAQKLSRQMSSRGWTKGLIKDTVDNPFTTRVSVNKATGNAATVFYTKQGSYVIVDDVTNKIVQISDNINPADWIPDSGIENPYKP